MKLPSYIQNRSDPGDSQTMTPMIDIVFLLLVFFICVATDQVIEQSLPTELATGGIDSSSQTDQQTWESEIWLRLISQQQGQGTLVKMEEAIYSDFDKLRQSLRQLAQISRKSPVILEVDDQVPLADLILVYDSCRAAEFDSINFAVQ